MQTLHVISHTHWDREWYLTFQQFRLKLVHLIDKLLDILDEDPDFKYFMLDGQTIVLDDYLHMRPEMESVLRGHIQSGRIPVGPWHILPDMFLVSPEAHIRNLLAGDREARKWGPKMMIGYMPDSFGHIGQMPQILRGFGIDNACLWRGLDDQPAEFWWQAPDGTRVLMLYLRDSYSNGASFNASDPNQFTEQAKQAGNSLAPHSASSHLLAMFGTDHMEPPIETSSAIKAANKNLKEYRVLNSTIPNYLSAVQSEIKNRKSEIPVVTGELRSSKRSHLLPGVLSTRMWIKQRNHASENLLEKWAEPFSAFSSLTTIDKRPRTIIHRPSSIVRQAWQLLMECHPHDSICGCSIDQVHDEMKVRFDQVDQIGGEIVQQSLEALSSVIQTDNRPQTTDHNPSSIVHCQSSVIVFNPLSFPRTDIASAEITLPSGVSNFEIIDEAGNVIPHQSASGQPSELINMRVRREDLGGLLGMINEGRAGNLAVQDLRFERNGATLNVEAIFAENASPNLDVWHEGQKTFQQHINGAGIENFHIVARLPDSAKITFAASDVPALGWKTFYVRAKESTPAEIKVSPLMKMLAPLAGLPFMQKMIAQLTEPKTRPPYVIENEFFTVELITENRTISVTDKSTGKTYHGLNRFVDGGDCGDEYNFSPPTTDSKQDTSTLKKISITRGAVQQTMIVSLSLSVPKELSADRKSRSTEMVELPITTIIALTNNIPRVDVHTHVDNCAKDHRLRVHFPVPAQKVETAFYDAHFDIIERKIGIPQFDSTWVEEPRPETHQRAFSFISNDQSSLTIANRGLPEVEVTSDLQIAITLLRCVGWLSRDDFSTRNGHAGPFLETPGAQMIGKWHFDYSIIPGYSPQHAWSFDAPLKATSTDIHAGQLPPNGSFVNVDHPAFVISAVKESEDGKGLIVRGYNISSEPIQVSLKPLHRFARAVQVNLAEEEISPVVMDGDESIRIPVGGHQVVSVMFSD